MIKYFQILIAIVLLASCKQKDKPLFVSLEPSKTSIDFANQLDTTKNISILDYLYYYNGGGVALGDINNDGLTDVYFSANQGKNKLYLNLGNNKFKDITDSAGVAGQSDWSTGSIMADVNGDGYLDIYVCAVVGINGFEGHNELFINNQDNTFTERSAEYGLDLGNYSSSAAFFDFDLDGDLDMYLLNHAVHSELSYGSADIRNKRSEDCGDKLFRNDNDKFVDISEKAGIYGGVNGYGLGVSIADFNMDGYPDIYVCNDFHEDDYYYLNNKNGTFTESLKAHFGHTSRFSMGVDAADINHDGYPDLMTLDMLPEDEKVLKSSLGDDNVQMLKLRTEKLGYHYQYSRNMLQINQGGNQFVECALLSGIAATDWSWSALFADFNQDGEQDIFVANGIPKRPNDLDYVKYYSNDEIRNKLNSTRLLDKQALKLMPEGKLNNYIFEGTATLDFKNQSANWLPDNPNFANGSAYGDLDNDGDLDLVTNNLNSVASVYSNQTNEKSTYLKINLRFGNKNTFGIGSKVITFIKGKKQVKELQTTRGFQSSSELTIHFGFKADKIIDSVLIIWPDQTFQTLKQVKTNQTLTIKPNANRKTFNYDQFHPKEKALFKKVDDNLGLDFVHQENDYIDFIYQKLIPYQRSDRGPATAIGDLNGDGKQDVFFGGSKEIPAQIYLQTASGFTKKDYPILLNDAIYEDASAVIGDFNIDNEADLFVASGGGQNAADLQSRLYFQKNGNLFKANLPEIAQNASVVKVCDYDKDGDLDLFVGNNSKNNKFGSEPNCYLLNNNKGVFTIVQQKVFNNIGMVTDAVFTNFNHDGNMDLIAVGEWMKPTFFANKNNKFQNITLKVFPEASNGLWQSVCSFDIDGDGDLDYLVGNWGLNSKFKASKAWPMKMYFDDFDNNGSFETIVALANNGKYYPTMGLDELAEQLSGFIKKKFNAYKNFAGKTLPEILSETALQKAKLFEVHTLQSGYLKNNKGSFVFVPFSNHLQVAPINTFSVININHKPMALAAGNYFGVSPYQGRFDSFAGALISNDKTFLMGNEIGLDFTRKQVRHLNTISVKDKVYLLATINNQPLQVFEILNSKSNEK